MVFSRKTIPPHFSILTPKFKKKSCLGPLQAINLRVIKPSNLTNIIFRKKTLKIIISINCYYTKKKCAPSPSIARNIAPQTKKKKKISTRHCLPVQISKAHFVHPPFCTFSHICNIHSVPAHCTPLKGLFANFSVSCKIAHCVGYTSFLRVCVFRYVFGSEVAKPYKILPKCTLWNK